MNQSFSNSQGATESDSQKLDALLQNLSYRSTPTLAPKQARLLELYRTVQENELNIALLNAWNSLPHSTSVPTQQDIQDATQSVLLSRAHFSIAQLATEEALMADPVLRAVHGPTNDGSSDSNAKQPNDETITSSAVSHRDSLSMLHSALTNRLSSLELHVRELETQRKEIWKSLPMKAKRVVELEKSLDPELELNLQGDGEGIETEWKEKLEKTEDEVKKARWEYRVVKGIASGIVVGSGVEWSGDESLVSMVIDDE